jgi:hypothetical protein
LLWASKWGPKEDIPVAYPNIEFKKPEGKPWLRMNKLNADSFQAGFGAAVRRWRNSGDVVVQVFIPIDSGEKYADNYADKIAEIFRGKKVGDLQMKAPSKVVVGAQPGGAWWQLNVEIPFYRDELI